MSNLKKIMANEVTLNFEENVNKKLISGTLVRTCNCFTKSPLPNFIKRVLVFRALCWNGAGGKCSASNQTIEVIVGQSNVDQTSEVVCGVNTNTCQEKYREYRL